MTEGFSISDEGIVYVPRYVRQVSDMEYGSVVTHENYNEKLNLNTTQGDYNTEILKLLFSNENSAEVPHVKYLDKIITEEVTRIDNVLNSHQTQINDTNARIDNVVTDLSALSISVSNIINGTTKVGKAIEADRIAGVNNVGASKYYGTDYNNNVGFHEMPASLYARDMSSGAVEIDGIYYTPRPNSIAEAMLTEELRTKINRETISDYDLLLNRPSINNVLLTGNKTLNDLGIQPAGNYITEIPDTYATKEYVNTNLNSYVTTTAADNKYATWNYATATRTMLTDVAQQNDNRYARIITTFAEVYINSADYPKEGDILISI